MLGRYAVQAKNVIDDITRISFALILSIKSNKENEE